jgi:Arc/MetJ-type ribon-helix-helix transcriptional regulator
MNIHLPSDLERSIRAEVASGHFASVDEAMAEAARLLLRRQPKAKRTSGKRANPVQEPKKALTRAEFDQLLIANGLLSQLPDTAADYDDPDDQPITIEGEPLSETIIRERR